MQSHAFVILQHSFPRLSHKNRLQKQVLSMIKMSCMHGITCKVQHFSHFGDYKIREIIQLRKNNVVILA